MTERIGELIALNEKAFVDPDVQLRWYYTDEERSSRLSKGFIFNDGAVGKHLSTIRIMALIRDSFYSTENENVHTVISGYGKGKSHFALVLANYFGRKNDDPIVYATVKNIRSVSTAGVATQFTAYKDEAKRPDLVVCLAGDRPMNLRSEFLLGLTDALKKYGLSGYRPKTIFGEGLTWLRKTAQTRGKELEEAARANQTSVAKLAGDLEAYSEAALGTLVEVSKVLNQGYATDFGGTLDLAQIIKEIYADLCGDGDKPFHRLLVLFDEFGLYLDHYLESQRMAGGTALQELLNGIRNLRGKAALVTFIQFEPEAYLRRERFGGGEGPERYTSRLAARYRMLSCLERVISALIVKKDEHKWRRFLEFHGSYLSKLSKLAHTAIPIYQSDQSQLPESVFSVVVTKECWPLHPITTALLCNYDFAQGRTVLGFVRQAIGAHLKEPATKGNDPAFILPLEILEYFGENFRRQEQLAGSGLYSRYLSVKEQRLGPEAPTGEIKALNAIFLYSSGGLTSSSKETYEQLLRLMAGLNRSEFDRAINSLVQKTAVYRDPARQVYAFYDRGSTIQDILDKARAQAYQKLSESHGQVIDFQMDEFRESLPDVVPNLFRDEHNIQSSGWVARQLLIGTADLETGLLKRRLEGGQVDEFRGVIIWVTPGDEAKLREARKKAGSVLDQLAVENVTMPIIIGIPREPLPDLLTYTGMLAVMKGWPQEDIRKLGIGYDNAKLSIQESVKGSLRALMDDSEYIVRNEVRRQLGPIPADIRQLVNEVFKCVYRFSPPMDFHLLHNLRGIIGNKAIGAVARKLVMGRVASKEIQDLDTAHKNLFDQVVSDAGTPSRSWQMAGDVIHPPRNQRARKCWDELERLLEVGRSVLVRDLYGILSRPPYGLDRFYFPLLLAAWYGMHSQELVIRGRLSSRSAPIQRIGEEELTSKLASGRDFLDWAMDVDMGVRIERINVQQIERAQRELLSKAQKVTSYDDAMVVLTQLNSESPFPNVPDDLQRPLVREQNRLSKSLEHVDRLKEKINTLCQTLAQANVLSRVIAIRSEIGDLSWSTGDLEAPHIIKLVESLRQQVEERIAGIASRLTSQRLDELENYALMKERLQTQLGILEGTEFQDLVQLTRQALSTLETDKQRIEASKTIASILEQVEMAEVTIVTPLKRAREIRSVFQKYLGSELANAPAAQRRRVETRLDEIGKVIGKQESWPESLSKRIMEIDSLDQANQLTREVKSEESIYFGTELEVKVREIGRVLGDVRRVLGLIPTTDDDPELLQKALTSLEEIGRDSPELRSLTDRASKKTMGRLRAMWERGHAWVEAEVQENVAGFDMGQIQRKLDKLKLPPAFVSTEDQEILESAIRHLEEVLEENRIDTIVYYFKQIQDDKARKECLRRLRELLEG